ncbi:methylated-DNA--[protein]-cysteine S-methyltransferase [Balneolales bacterium ANBcel1]|nr:methylated-DNA--[protein]-cysteine S-methyltransferase [Balneolales bacterium ANBcel1]
MNKSGKDFYDRVYEVVARIPEGRVTTYGAIARHLGTGGSARLVGWALNKTLSNGHGMLPCHRVVNRTGALTGKSWFGGDVMEQMLRAEGVAFDEHGCVDMERHFWEP